MLSDEELRRRLRNLEADTVERTVSLSKTDKFGEAICAFANDLADRREVGVLFIGARDDGSCAGITVTEQLLQTLAGFRSNGNITPFPCLSVAERVIDGCPLVVVEVEPSDNPPLKYNGRVCVRVGLRRGYATPEEERRLVEKRRWGNLPFDQHSQPGATITDLDLLRFREDVLPSMVAPDVLAENGRSMEQHLQALRMTGQDGRPTAAGLLVCGRDPLHWLPGAYVQFVRYPGREIGDYIQDERQISGPLADVFRRLDDLIAAHNTRPADLSRPLQESRPAYPVVALQEIFRNAVIHRNYESSSSPVRILWFDDRVEITSPGGPYGEVTADLLGREGGPTAYRNPTIAQIAKDMNFVQKFGSGIPRTQAALLRNDNPPAEFRVEPTFVNVTIRATR